MVPSFLLLVWVGSGVMTEKGAIGEAVKTAVRVGYRHIDCASVYGSEKEIGSSLNDIFQSGFKREDIWITSKLWCNAQDCVEEAFEKTLSDLQLDYLDLYLIHWPVRLRKESETKPKPDDFLPLQLQQTWQEMEKLAKNNRVRAIGVSNFSAKNIENLLAFAKIVPAVNQVECHPVWQQTKLRDYCASKGIHISGYSPLGKRGPLVLNNSLIKEAAEKLGKTPAQIALRWGIQSGHSVLPKSSNAERLKQNLEVSMFSLPDDYSFEQGIEQKRLVEGREWLNGTTSPYSTLEDLWDDNVVGDDVTRPGRVQIEGKIKYLAL